MRTGRLVFESYKYSRLPSDRFASFSMTKSVVAILVGIALDEERNGSLDDLAKHFGGGRLIEFGFLAKAKQFYSL